MTLQPPCTTHPAEEYLRALFLCRELGAACQRFATAATVQNIQRGLHAGLITEARGFEGGDIGHNVAMVAKLVLQDLEVPEYRFACQATQDGLQALQALQAAVFGSDSLQRSFVECAFLAHSLAQTARAADLVTAAVLDALGPHNCLTLFSVAAACGCVPLRRAAHAMALRSFSAAFQRDADGLVALQEPHLLRLLCSDHLQVSSELEVASALVAWTKHDVAVRTPGLAPRLTRCMRLGGLTPADLHLVEESLQELRDAQAFEAVAKIFLHLFVGLPLGLPTIERPRRQQTSIDVDVGARMQCGMPAHAGQHASVFEAAACSLVQQREQAATPATAPQLPAAPALQPASRVRYLGTASRHSAAKRTLFEAAGCRPSPAVQQQQQQLATGGSAPAAVAGPAALCPVPQAATACSTGSLACSLTDTMAASPSRRSPPGIKQHMVAVPAERRQAGSKRLRFD